MAKKSHEMKVVVIEGPMFQQARQNAYAAANRIFSKMVAQDKPAASTSTTA